MMSAQELLLDSDDVAALLSSSSAPSFAWAPCTYSLHTTEGAWPHATTLKCPPAVSASMERPPAALQKGWTWHKNHQLPRLNVKCAASLPAGAACLVSAVTVNVMSHAAHDAGLEGTTLQPLVNGACSFSSLAFKTTSYNLKGKSLHLMVSLLLRDNDRLHVASSLISPPIVVDARKRQAKEKEARGNAESGTENIPPTQTALLPFAPAMLERKLEKVDRQSERHEIDNSMAGLRAYLSALNIRNKCKHPLFLVLRFDSCVGLFYDADSLGDDPLRDDETFYAMMRALGAVESGKATPPTSTETGACVELPPFVIAIKAIHDTHACARLDCPIQLPSSLSLLHAAMLPESYRMFCDHQLTTLRRTYCRLHCTHRAAPVVPPREAYPEQPCDVCGVVGPSMLTLPEHWPAKRHAIALLASARERAMGVLGDDTQDPCPEREWEAGIRVLAEALALHCRTRSADEIVAFMHGEEASARKRHNHEHSHAMLSWQLDKPLVAEPCHCHAETPL